MQKQKGSLKTAKRKRGRPTKKTPQVVEKIYELARKGRSDKEIAEITGLTHRTLSNWKTWDFEFLSTFNEARKIADNMVEVSLFQKAVGYSHPDTKVFCNDGNVTTVPLMKHYPPDAIAAKFWLTNRQPERWREKLEHTGADGGPMEVKVTVEDYTSGDDNGSVA